MAKTVDKISVAILIFLMIASYAWANIKHMHEYATRIGKFKQVYTKLKVDMAMV